MDITDGRICRGGAQETDHGTYEAVLNIDGRSCWLGERDTLKEALALYGKYRKIRNVGSVFTDGVNMVSPGSRRHGTLR